MKLSTKIKTERKRLKLTTEELSKQIGVSHSKMVNFEHGRSTPKPVDLIRLSEAFGITLDNLLGVKWNTEDPDRNDLFLVEYKETLNEDGKKKQYGTEVFVGGVWLCREIKGWKEIV